MGSETAFPIIEIKIHDQILTIYRCIQGYEEKLYEAAIRNAIVLDGFDDFSLSIQDQVLDLKLEKDAYHLKITSNKPLSLPYDLDLQGDLSIEAPHITLSGAYRSVLGKVRFKGNLEQRKGLIYANQGVQIAGQDLILSTVFSETNIDVWVGNSVNLAKNALQAKGTLCYHWETEKKLELDYINPLGSVQHEGKQNLEILADQSSARDLIFGAQGNISIGNADQSPILHAERCLYAQSQEFTLHKGILHSKQGTLIKSRANINLGNLSGFQASLKSLDNIELDAIGQIFWNYLEIECEKDLILRGKVLDNTSSRVRIRGDATWLLPSKHSLTITNRMVNKVFYGQQGSNPSLIIIDGKLTTGVYETIINGSKLFCKSIDPASRLPNCTNFAPYTIGSETYISGYTPNIPAKKHGAVHRVFHSHSKPSGGEPKYDVRQKVIFENAIVGQLCVGSNLESSVPILEVSGILSALSIKLRDIQVGYIGNFEAHIHLAPMPVKAFRNRIPLIDFFKPTPLYKMSSEDGTVFKAVFPSVDAEPFSRMVLRNNGYLSPNTENLPRLFPQEQEQMLLGEALLEECGAGFFDKHMTNIHETLDVLGKIGISYGNAAQFTIQDHSSRPALVHAAGQHGLQMSRFESQLVHYTLAKPCVVDEPFTMIFENGLTREVTSPVLYLPPSCDNRRLRDGASCLLSFGDILFQGTLGAQLHIKGNIDAQEGVVSYNDFSLVSRTANTWTEDKLLTTTIREKTLTSKPQVTRQGEMLSIVHLQPGNETVAKGERYECVDVVHRMCVKDTLGDEGLVVENAEAFIDEGLVQLQIGPEKTTKNKGLLGLSSTRIRTRPVTQKALGSVVHSKGPVRIQARYARMDATKFQDLEGNDKQVSFEIQELHFHDLIKAIAAHEKQAAKLLANQKKTAKRKKRQGLFWLIVSIPVSYYAGAFLAGFLQGLGVTGVKIAIAKGAVMGATSSAIRGQNIKQICRSTWEGGLFAGIGYGVSNIGMLKGCAELTKDIVRCASVATVQSVLRKQNVLDNLLISTTATVAGGLLFPSSAANPLSLGQLTAKSMLESGITLVMSDGRAEDLAINLATAAIGAWCEKQVSDVGTTEGFKAAAYTTSAYQSFKTAASQVFSTRQESDRLTHSRETVALFDTITKQATRILVANDIPVTETEVRQAFAEHPLLQGNDMAIQANLKAVGRQSTPNATPADCLNRGASIVFGSILDSFAEANLNAQYSGEDRYPRTGLNRSANDFMSIVSKPQRPKPSFISRLLACLIAPAYAEEDTASSSMQALEGANNTDAHARARRKTGFRYTPYADAVKASRRKDAKVGLNKTTDDYMNQKFYELKIKIYGIGMAGHVAMCVPVWDENIQGMVEKTIGLYPDNEGKLHFFDPLFSSKGKIVPENDVNLGPNQLITESYWITQEQLTQLCKNVQESIENTGRYNLFGIFNQNCLSYVEEQLAAIGISRGINDLFNVMDYQDLKWRPIKIQLYSRFKENRAVVHFIHTHVAERVSSEYQFSPGQTNAYWGEVRAIDQSYKDADAVRKDRISNNQLK